MNMIQNERDFMGCNIYTFDNDTYVFVKVVSSDIHIFTNDIFNACIFCTFKNSSTLYEFILYEQKTPDPGDCVVLKYEDKHIQDNEVIYSLVRVVK